MNIIVQPAGGAALTIGDGTNFKVQKPISGLESAPQRNTTGDFSGSDGGYIGSQFYSIRDVSIPGIILSADVTSHAIDRQLFINAFPINKDINVTFIMPNGQSFFMLARRSALTCEQQSASYSEYKVELISSDSLLYDVTGGNAINVNVPIKSGGGFVAPVIPPIVSSAGSGPTVINNTGSAIIYPVITISNSATNPVITNLTTGQSIKINTTLSNGDILVIDMKQRTVSLNGSNILASRDSSSSWWGLALGLNQIQLTTDSGANTGVGVVTYRPAAVGV
jgi:hypothetical protein